MTVQPSQTPFRPAWFGTNLPGVRPAPGTYGGYETPDFSPPPGVVFDGTYAWLLQEPKYERSIYDLDHHDIPATLKELTSFCREHQISLPPAFLPFFSTPNHGTRIRSNTDCYVNLTSRTITTTYNDGLLVRFLTDSQWVVAWYLYLPASGQDHCVVSTLGLLDPDPEWNNPDIGESIFYCAPSFEQFMFRFWLENEYWFTSISSPNFPYPKSSPSVHGYFKAVGWPVPPRAK